METIQQQIQEAELDIQELQGFLDIAQRKKNQTFLSNQISTLQNRVESLKQKQRDDEAKSLQEKKKTTAASTPLPSNVQQIKSYAWDQSDEFIKLYISEDAKQVESEENIKLSCPDSKTCLLEILLPNKLLRLRLENLEKEVLEDKSYVRLKPKERISVFLKKKEKKNWMELVEKKNKIADTNVGKDTSDPGAGLMDILKKMYAEGDTETKKMIAESWTKAQKGGKGPAMGDL